MPQIAPWPKSKKIGRVTFRKLTDEEALREYGSSFVFVGQPVNARRAEEAASKNEVVSLPKTAKGKKK
jgi:hypothetical protein